MKNRLTRTFRTAVVIACVASLASVASAATPNKPPYVKKFSWGTFHLAPRIAAKLQQHKPLNVVLSVNGTATPVYGPQYAYAFPLGLKTATKKYGVALKGKIIGPVQSNPAEQINQILSAIKSNQIDCLGVTASDAGFAPVVNAAVKAGIPTFTTGADANGSNRFSTFQTDWTHEGQVAAQATADFFKKKGVKLTTAALTSGGAATLFAQTRMKAYYDRLKQLVPGINFVNSPSDALDTSFDPAATYSAVRAFLQGHTNIQAIYQTDIAGGVVDKAVDDLGLHGKTYVIGHNVDLSVLSGIKDGTQIATLDQNYLAQGQFPALACGAYFKSGKVLPNTNVPALITAANVDQARAQFIKTTQPKG